MSTTTRSRTTNRLPTVSVPQGLGRALLAAVGLVLVATVAFTLVPELALVVGLAVWAGLVVATVAMPFAVVALVVGLD